MYFNLLRVSHEIGFGEIKCCGIYLGNPIQGGTEISGHSTIPHKYIILHNTTQ